MDTPAQRESTCSKLRISAQDTSCTKCKNKQKSMQIKFKRIDCRVLVLVSMVR